MAPDRIERGPRLQEIYARLLAAYGPQRWWPGDGGFEMIAGAILTQRAAWSNAERALGNLRSAEVLSAGAILRLAEADLAQLVRPAGTFNVKARKLRAFAQMLSDEFGGRLECLLALPLAELRLRLLATYGIGPETADAIVLYAAGQPSFVIDAYTRRIFERLGLAPVHDAYDAWRRLFMEALPADAQLFNEYHALMVRHAKTFCRPQPRCAPCPLRSDCPAGADHGVATGERVTPASGTQTEAVKGRERP